MQQPNPALLPGVAPDAPIPRASWKLIAILCLIFVGITFTESISNILLPLTIRKYTEDPRLIGLILAINPLFGFIAQPLVGVLSDRVWTRFGRRAFFMIISAPIVAGCLLAIPFAAALWQLVIYIVVYQFFEDILFGSDHPLLADLVPAEQRSFVVSAMTISSQFGTLMLQYYGLAAVERYNALSGGEHYGLPVYATGAILQVGFVMGLSFFLKERRVLPKARPALTLKRYVRDFTSNTMLLRLAVINFLRAFIAATLGGYMSLYAVKTLLLPEGSFGRISGIATLITFAFAIPIAFLAERMSKRLLLQLSFGLVIIACAFGIAARSGWLGEATWPASAQGLPNEILFMFFFHALGGLALGNVTKAFITEFFDRDIVGQLQGAINVFFATGRTLGLVIVPYFIFVKDDYTPIFYVALVVSAVAILLLASVRDVRYAERRARQRVVQEPPAP